MQKPELHYLTLSLLMQKIQDVLTRVLIFQTEVTRFFFLVAEKLFQQEEWHVLFGVDLFLLVIPDNFYENLKKLRVDDNFIVKSIRSTVLSRVSLFQFVPNSAFYFFMWKLECSCIHSSDL